MFPFRSIANVTTQQFYSITRNAHVSIAQAIVKRLIFTQTVIATALAVTDTQRSALDALKIQPAYTHLVAVPIQTQHLMNPPMLVLIAQLTAKEK